MLNDVNDSSTFTNLNDTYADSTYFHTEKNSHICLRKVAKRPVPVQKGEYLTPKKYAEFGIRIHPLRQPYPHKMRGEYDSSHLEIEAFQAKHPHQTGSKNSFSMKLNCNAPEFSPNFNPSRSAVGLNASAPEFSPSLSSRGLSPLAKPFTPLRIGLSPLAAPFVPAVVPEEMAEIDLGQSLRSVMNAEESCSNIASFTRGEKIYEIHRFASM